MSDGFSQYQKSQLGVSAAKARAISERSYAQFSTEITALEEKEALERAADELQQIAQEAERNARKRGRKAGFGRFIGSLAGYAIGGPAGQAALGTALGGLAGTAAAGGFKEYGVDVPDSLVPGGIFYGRERDAFKQRIDDLDEAFEDLTDAQRQGIGKNVITDYLTGRGLGKLGEANIEGLDVSLDDLLEAGEISNVDYLKDIFRSVTGGIGEDRLSVLTELSDNSPILSKFTSEYTDPTKLIEKYSSGEIPLDKPEELKKLMYGMTGYKIDPETGNILDELQPRLRISSMEEQGALADSIDNLFQSKKESTLQQSDELDASKGFFDEPTNLIEKYSSPTNRGLFDINSVPTVATEIDSLSTISEFKNQATQQNRPFDKMNYEMFLDVNENLPRGLSQLNKEQQNTLYNIISDKIVGGKLGVDYTPYEQQLLGMLSFDQRYKGSQLPGYFDDLYQYEKDAYKTHSKNRDSIFSQQTPLRYLQGI